MSQEESLSGLVEPSPAAAHTARSAEELDRTPLVALSPAVGTFGVAAVRVCPNPQVAALVETNLELPPMPGVAQRVFVAAHDPNITTKAIADIVQSDAALVAKLLAVCNSSFYGLRRKVSSVQHAVTLLGFRELFNLVVGTAARFLFRRVGPLEQPLWEHSVACAMASHLVAELLAPSTRDVAYVAGQLHDVGHAVLSTRDAAALGAILQLPDDQARLDAEIQMFGITHVDVGALLIRRWNLPASLETAAFLHHDPALCSTLAPEHAPLVSVVAVADHLCHLAGVGRPPDSDVPPQAVLDALANLDASADQLPSLLARFQRHYAAERAHLD